MVATATRPDNRFPRKFQRRRAVVDDDDLLVGVPLGKVQSELRQMGGTRGERGNHFPCA